VREQYERISSMLKQKNQELLMYSKEIQQLEKMKEEKMKLTQNYQLEIRKITHKLQQWEKEIKDSQRLIQSYLKEHNWINKEKQFFGQQNTDFDFQFRDMKQLRQKLEELKEEQVSLMRLLL
jgi:structural maintenance of chromosome 2